MLEQLFAIRYTVLVNGTVYGYTLSEGVALVFTLPPSGDPEVIGTVKVERIGHKVQVASYLESVI